MTPGALCPSRLPLLQRRRRLVLPVHSLVCLAAFSLALPLAISLFPQMSEVIVLENEWSILLPCKNTKWSVFNGRQFYILLCCCCAVTCVSILRCVFSDQSPTSESVTDVSDWSLLTFLTFTIKLYGGSFLMRRSPPRCNFLSSDVCRASIGFVHPGYQAVI